MEFESILYEIQDDISYLTLNHPKIHNTLTPKMWGDVSATVQYTREDG